MLRVVRQRTAITLIFLVSLEMSLCWSQSEKGGDTKSFPGKSSPGSPPEAMEDASAEPVDAAPAILPGRPPSASSDAVSLGKNLWSDQNRIWSSPLRLRTQDAGWLAPLGLVTAGLIASDHAVMQNLPESSQRITLSRDFSNAGAAATVGTAAGFYLWGAMAKSDSSRETGTLSGEALVNATVVAEALKLVTERPRPDQDNGHGQFWHGGASFPSEHAMAAWSVASVIVHQYPGPLTRLLAYGAASAIDISRITGREHFPSDVFIGTALGWYLGRQTFRWHHEPDLGGPGPSSGETRESQVSADRSSQTPVSQAPVSQRPISQSPVGQSTNPPELMGSPYVPLDSWVYPAFERLAALGYGQTAFLDLRPWTRMECARLLRETMEQLQVDALEDGQLQDGQLQEDDRLRSSDGRGANGAGLYAALAEEFADETARLDGARNQGVSLDSVYARTTEISGTPLRDGFHFGQTIVNDFGRPYWTGFNAVSGLSAHAVAGPFAFQVREEYQHAPAVPSESPATIDITAAADGVPALANRIAQNDRSRVLEATVAIKLGLVQLSFGEQSLWLGPSEAGPLLFTDNAEPMPMLKIDATTPYRIPLLSRLLGPVRFEFFMGRLAGQTWEFSPTLFGPGLRSQPFVHGTKLSFKPTPNLEIGAGFTAQFGGPGNPVTWSNFARTFYSHRTSTGDGPAKRLSEISVSYRIPPIRDWLLVYTDSMVIDEYSPLVSNRPALNPGIYLPHLPNMPKVELRLEGVTTDLNVPAHFGPGAFYWDSRYRSGYTNDGNLLGNWVGRRGRGEQAWITYSFSPRSTLQFGYRHNDVDKGFAQGGHLRDLSLGTNLRLRHDLEISIVAQQEDWTFPALSAAAKSDVTASLQLTWWPRTWKK